LAEENVVATPKALRIGYPDSYLPSRINYFRRKVLPFVFDDAAESVLDGRVVTLDEVAVNETDCK
jgi:hypothetical protein